MSAYRLSVVGSIAPPGTAWDAEGLRGNEANENNLMVLVWMRARKCQNGRVLHKRTLPEVWQRCLASGRSQRSRRRTPNAGAGSRSAGDFAGPLLSLPIGNGDGIGVDMEAVANAAGGFPLAAFVRQHELVNGAQQTSFAPENRLGFQIQRYLLQNFGDGHFEHDIEHGEQAQQEEIGVAMPHERGQQLAETGTNQGAEYEIAGFILACADGRDQAYPAAHLAVAENREGMAHRMNFILESKPGRVHVAQQPVADGGFGLNQFVELGHVKFGPGDGLQHAYVIEGVGRNVVRGHHFRTAQEVALKVDKALIPGGDELGMVLHLFRQHAAAPGAVLFYQCRALLEGGELEIDLKDVGHFHQRSAWIVADVVIERD